MPHCHGQCPSPASKDHARTRIYVYKGCLSTSTKCAFLTQMDFYRIARDSLAITSNAPENVSYEVFRAPKAVAPRSACDAVRLFGSNFVERFAFFLKGRHPLASPNQEVAIEG